MYYKKGGVFIMKSAKINAFYSCSFDSKYKEIYDYFLAICNGLDIKCVNVDKGSSKVPPDVARKLIDSSQILIAVATRAIKTDKNKYSMPPAVREEISMAYAKEKPILILRESDVLPNGFTPNYGTYLPFSRDELYKCEFLSKAIASIHDIKMDVLLSHDVLIEQEGISDFYLENSFTLISLEKDNNGYYWHYSMSRKYVFTDKFTKSIKGGAWAPRTTKNVNTDETMHWNVEITNSSRHFEPEINIEKEQVDHVELDITFNPPPEENDFIEISFNCKSKYLNPIFLDELDESPPFVKIDNMEYECGDGFLAITRLKFAKLQFRFPVEYGLKMNEFVPIVASFSSKIDYIADDELKRMKVNG